MSHISRRNEDVAHLEDVVTSRRRCRTSLPFRGRLLPLRSTLLSPHALAVDDDHEVVDELTALDWLRIDGTSRADRSLIANGHAFARQRRRRRKRGLLASQAGCCMLGARCSSAIGMLSCATNVLYLDQSFLQVHNYDYSLTTAVPRDTSSTASSSWPARRCYRSSTTRRACRRWRSSAGERIPQKRARAAGYETRARR